MGVSTRSSNSPPTHLLKFCCTVHASASSYRSRTALLPRTPVAASTPSRVQTGRTMRGPRRGHLLQWLLSSLLNVTSPEIAQNCSSLSNMKPLSDPAWRFNPRRTRPSRRSATCSSAPRRCPRPTPPLHSLSQLWRHTRGLRSLLNPAPRLASGVGARRFSTREKHTSGAIIKQSK